MALTVTSLNGAITQAARQATLTAFSNPSTGGVGPSTVALIDGEGVLITGSPFSPTVDVVRGYTNPFTNQGTVAVAHNTLAPVVYGLTSDFSQLGVQGSASIAIAAEASYGVNGAITVPLVNQTIYITKAGVCALTLASPSADSNVTVRFVALTANAHTITYTPGFYGNTTSSDVCTFPGTIGAVFTIVAKNGLWNAVATADDGCLIG